MSCGLYFLLGSQSRSSEWLINKDLHFKAAGDSRSWFSLMHTRKEEEKTSKLCNYCWCAESQRHRGSMVQLARLPWLGAITHLHCIHSRFSHFTSCFPSTNTLHRDRVATRETSNIASQIISIPAGCRVGSVRRVTTDGLWNVVQTMSY